MYIRAGAGTGELWMHTQSPTGAILPRGGYLRLSRGREPPATPDSAVCRDFGLSELKGIVCSFTLVQQI